MTCGRNQPDVLPGAAGRTAAFMAADVRDPDQAAALVDATVDQFGRIDAVINNAGGAPRRTPPRPPAVQRIDRAAQPARTTARLPSAPTTTCNSVTAGSS
ncbi:MAG: SDR family oxidoreductase [Microthrixaceae bacterium]|nr:SDR family oxidoreductase [Microthrixaceae bacterium]